MSRVCFHSHIFSTSGKFVRTEWSHESEDTFTDAWLHFHLEAIFPCRVWLCVCVCELWAECAATACAVTACCPAARLFSVWKRSSRAFSSALTVVACLDQDGGFFTGRLDTHWLYSKKRARSSRVTLVGQNRDFLGLCLQRRDHKAAGAVFFLPCVALSNVFWHC